MSNRCFAFAITAVAALATLSGFTQGTGYDALKEAADATWHAPVEPDALEPLGALPTDLDRDWANPHWPMNDTLIQDALAIRPYLELSGTQFRTYTYVLVKHRRADGYFDALVAKLDSAGARVGSFGTNGFKQMAVGFDSMGAAAFGPGGLGVGSKRVYFAGSKLTGSVLDTDMVVLCFDLGTADGTCSGWPAGSYRTVAFDLGGLKTDIGNVIAYDPDGYVFVGGKVATPDGIAMGIAKLDATNGNLVTTFGSNGNGRAWYALNGAGYDPEVTASAFAPAGTPGGKRLYVGGSYRPGTTAADRDGFVLSVDPATASYLKRDVYYESDNADRKKDEVTALAVLKTGKVVLAGWSETDDANYPTMLLGQLKAGSISYDTGFCGGGLCSHAQTSIVAWLGTRSVRPRAIAAREMNGDLVVALDGRQRTFSDVTWRPVQKLELWSRSGATIRTSMTNEYSANTDADRGAGSRALSVSDSDVLLAGIRRWNSSDDDITVSRHLRMDSIFAADFGGTDSD